eukprot:6187566-Pleurochrysis_carterae.AAC.1
MAPYTHPPLRDADTPSPAPCRGIGLKGCECFGIKRSHTTLLVGVVYDNVDADREAFDLAEFEDLKPEELVDDGAWKSADANYVLPVFGIFKDGSSNASSEEEASFRHTPRPLSAC